MTRKNNNNYILAVKGISKSFFGVHALENVDLMVKKGEVHALVGENGAGKSTLMKIIMGQQPPDSGSIVYDGKDVSIDTPAKALKLGISMIYQELNPIPYMSIADNIFLGREVMSRVPFLVNKKKLNEMAHTLLKRFNVALHPGMLMSDLSIAQIQMIEIVKAVSYDSKLIIMDEPTSSLSDEEVKELFRIIENLREKGVSIIYISHRMEEIFQLSDRVTVLRDGSYIGTDETRNVTQATLISMMVGRELKNLFPKKDIKIEEPVLEVKNLTRKNVFNDITFSVRKGEILGIAGLVGAGRTEIARAIFGLDPIDEGRISLDGKIVKIKSPGDAINYGIDMVSEDRKEVGLVLCRSIKENIALPNLKQFTTGSFINFSKEKQNCQDVSSNIQLKMYNLQQEVNFLSGGNQQKVVIAKWLLAEPKVLILDEPTRGIDVGAKAEIYKLMSSLAAEGLAIIMISSELPEIMGMSDRVLVIHEGSLQTEYERKDILSGKVTEKDILQAAFGGVQHA
jgi:inositol transport system ATP-binding protein